MVTTEYLADTNALSESARPSPSAAFLARWEEHFPRIAIAATSWHEAHFGALLLDPGSRRRAEIEAYLAGVRSRGLTVLPYTEDAATWHAGERRRLRASGVTVSFQDGQIAAVAVTSGLKLVTANIRDFSWFRGLTVVDWLA